MGRPITLFTGPWTDLPLEDVARKASELGYQALELACWGGHFDVQQALADDSYCAARRDLAERHDLEILGLASQPVGQAVLDRAEEWRQSSLPPRVWGDGDPDGVSARAAEELKDTARAAQKLGVETVAACSGSSVWHLACGPGGRREAIAAGYGLFAERFDSILDVFGECGVRLALEVRPGQVAFDLYSAEQTLAALDRREELGVVLDPSQLFWQGIDPVEFLRTLGDRIYLARMKDAVVKIDGRASILAGHLSPGDRRRGWDFRSPGRGGVNFEELIRALNSIQYMGPLSVDWEDPDMDREAGAKEARDFLRHLDFTPNAAPQGAAYAEGY